MLFDSCASVVEAKVNSQRQASRQRQAKAGKGRQSQAGRQAKSGKGRQIHLISIGARNELCDSNSKLGKLHYFNKASP